MTRMAEYKKKTGFREEPFQVSGVVNGKPHLLKAPALDAKFFVSRCPEPSEEESSLSRAKVINAGSNIGNPLV